MYEHEFIERLVGEYESVISKEVFIRNVQYFLRWLFSPDDLRELFQKHFNFADKKAQAHEIIRM